MLEFFFLFLLVVIMFSFQPFTSSASMPSAIRVPLLLLFTFFTVLASIKKKRVFYFFLIGGTSFIVLFYLWIRNSPESLSDIFYLVTLIIFTFCFYYFLKRIPRLIIILSQFWLLLVLFISIFSIVSFFAFNFNLLPYTKGELEQYKYFFNPFLGYVHQKDFENFSVGRVCHFMLEPSYLAFFLTANFFFLDSVPMNYMMKYASKILVFLGAMSTVSTAAWVVFGIIFSISIIYWLIKKLQMSENVARLFACGVLAVILIYFISLPKERLIQIFGTSSYEDRENRINASILILASSNPKNILFGNSPAYIEHQYNKGESNQYFKLLVEEGIIVTVLVIVFIAYCTRYNFKFLVAVLLFLNSVVILWTPLFCINLILCRVLTEEKKMEKF